MVEYEELFKLLKEKNIFHKNNEDHNTKKYFQIIVEDEKNNLFKSGKSPFYIHIKNRGNKKLKNEYSSDGINKDDIKKNLKNTERLKIEKNSLYIIMGFYKIGETSFFIIPFNLLNLFDNSGNEYRFEKEDCDKLSNKYEEIIKLIEENSKEQNNKEQEKTEKMEETKKNNNILKKKKQIILYGPPGTGKTYNTKNIIYNSINNETDLLKKNDKKEIDANYKDLEKKGQVKFITFHQSFAYEEFIEGLKPIEGEKNSNLERDYRVENGIFKEICEKTILTQIKISKELSNEKNKIIDFEESYKSLLNKITENDNFLLLKTKTGKEFKISVNSNNNLNLYTGENKNKQGVLTKNNILSVIKNEIIYEGWESYYNSVINKLNVLNELDKLKNINFKNINFKNKTIKKSSLEEFYNLTREERKELFEKEELKPYFLIIDEINRGNISKIFGELITLLEKDKRLGQENELITTLPYSKEKFGIPPNLYIIATMNTSDKSIANLDVALRRRFGFIEMPPISNLDEITTNCEEINLQNLLQTINKRIEFLLDKDHLIGHSYFMNINSIKELKEVFYNEIIPLLEEYFYGDYEKLQLVLGKEFVKTEKISEAYVKKIFGNKQDDLTTEDSIYKLIKEEDINFEDVIKNIIKPKEESNE